MHINTKGWERIEAKNLLANNQIKLINKKKEVLKDNTILPFLKNKNNKEDFKVLSFVKSKFKNIDKILLIGTGGSSLGAKVFLEIIKDSQIYFLENLDPNSINFFLEKYKKKRLGLLVISKSGETIEIISLFEIIMNKLSKNINFNKNAVIVSDNKDSILKNIANKFNIFFVNHEKNIGGRYSCFSVTGLLPLNLAGYNASNAKKMADTFFNNILLNNKKENLNSTCILSSIIKKKKYTGHVFLCYLDNYYQLGQWYKQLWNESLGKEQLGLHLITAQGAIDQHSQLQMWMDGPKNLIFSVVLPKKRAKDLKVQDKRKILPYYLKNKKAGEILNIMGEATVFELKKAGIPTRIIYVDDDGINEAINLMANLMLEVTFIAKLIGIDPFSQPSVEKVKFRTKELLKNYESD